MLYIKHTKSSLFLLFFKLFIFTQCIFVISLNQPAAIKYYSRQCRWPLLHNGQQLILEYKIVDNERNIVPVDDVVVELNSKDSSSLRLLGSASEVSQNGNVTFDVYVVGNERGPHEFRVSVRNLPDQDRYLDILSETCVIGGLKPGPPEIIFLTPLNDSNAQMMDMPPNVIWSAIPWGEPVDFTISAQDIFGNPTQLYLVEDVEECEETSFAECVLLQVDSMNSNGQQVSVDKAASILTVETPENDNSTLSITLSPQGDQNSSAPLFSASFNGMNPDNFPQCHLPQCFFWDRLRQCNDEQMVSSLPDFLSSEVHETINNTIHSVPSPVILFDITEQISNQKAQMALIQDPFYLNIGQTLVQVSSFDTINYTSNVEINYQWCSGISDHLWTDSVQVFKSLIWKKVDDDSPYRMLCYVEDETKGRVLPVVFNADEHVVCCYANGVCTDDPEESTVALALFVFHLVVSILAGLYITAAMWITVYKSDFEEKALPSRYHPSNSFPSAYRSFIWIFCCWLFLPLVVISFSAISFAFAEGSEIMIAEGCVTLFTCALWWICAPIILTWIFVFGASRISKILITSLFSILVGETAAILVIFALWSTVGLIINPLRVLPFFAAVISVIGWMSNFVSKTSQFLSAMEGYVRRAALKRYNCEFIEIGSVNLDAPLSTGNLSTFSKVLDELDDLISSEAKKSILKDIETFRRRAKVILIIGGLSFGFWLLLTAAFLCLAVLSFSDLSLLQSLIASAMQSLSGVVASGIDGIIEAQRGLADLRDSAIASSMAQAIRKSVQSGELKHDSLKTLNEIELKGNLESDS